MKYEKGRHGTFRLEKSQFFSIVPAVEIRIDIDEFLEFPKLHKADKRTKSQPLHCRNTLKEKLAPLLLLTHACRGSRSVSAVHQMNPGKKATVSQLGDH